MLGCLLDDSEISTLLTGFLLSFKLFISVMLKTLCICLDYRWRGYSKVLSILSVGIRVCRGGLIVLVRGWFFMIEINKLWGFRIGRVFEIISPSEFHGDGLFDINRLSLTLIGGWDGFESFFMMVSKEGIFICSYSLHSYINLLV